MDGLTPAGGAYSVAAFTDERGQPCPEWRATAMFITEHAEDGTLLHSTFGYLGSR